MDANLTRRQLAEQGMDKAQKKLVPFILLMFILSFLDRANVGFAKTEFQLSTGISDAAFALGIGVFFIGYAVFEVPSNIILHHVGARKWLARIMVTWGLVAAGFALVSTETQYLVMRVLLGICEAGFFPGIIYYFTCWFTSTRRSTVMGIFYFGTPLSFVFGAPLSGLLLDMNGFAGFLGWQWMFAIEGLLATLVGIWAFFYLVDRPDTAKFIPEAEKQALITELEIENANKPKGHTSPWKILANKYVLFMALMYFTIQLAVYGVVFYLPTQVAAMLGKKVGLEVGLVSAIPWVFAVMATATIPRYSDRSGKRGILAAGLMIFAGLGIITSATSSPVLGIAALSVAAMGLFSAQPIFWTMPSRILNGVAAASSIGFINAIGNLGGFVAPSLRVWAEQFFHTSYAGLYVLGIAAFISSILFFVSIAIGIGKNIQPDMHCSSEKSVAIEGKD